MAEPHDCADGAEPLHIAGQNLYSLWDCGSQQWIQWVGTGQCLEVYGNGAVFEGGPFDLYLEGVMPFWSVGHRLTTIVSFIVCLVRLSMIWIFVGGRRMPRQNGGSCEMTILRRVFVHGCPGFAPGSNQ